MYIRRGRAAVASIYLGCLSFFPLTAPPCTLPLAFFFSVQGGIFFSFMPPFAAGGGGGGGTFALFILVPFVPPFAATGGEGGKGFGFGRRGGGSFGCPVFLFGSVVSISPSLSYSSVYHPHHCRHSPVASLVPFYGSRQCWCMSAVSVRVACCQEVSSFYFFALVYYPCQWLEEHSVASAIVPVNVCC